MKNYIVTASQSIDHIHAFLTFDGIIVTTNHIRAFLTLHENQLHFYFYGTPTNYCGLLYGVLYECVNASFMEIQINTDRKFEGPKLYVRRIE